MVAGIGNYHVQSLALLLEGVENLYTVMRKRAAEDAAVRNWN
jgi:hypothetical protein